MHLQSRPCNKLERFSVVKRYLVLISRICALAVGATTLFFFANVCAYVYLKPTLPNVDTLRDVQLQVPLRVYTRDGRLIASIGEQRRIPVRYGEIPKLQIDAFLAAEDDRFFQHPGVDWEGIVRAALANDAARKIPCQSTPWCSKNRAARNASTFGGSGRGRRNRRCSPIEAIRRPSRV